MGVTGSMGYLSTALPDCGFFNPGGSRNLGAATSCLSLDQFAQLHSKYNILEEQVRELAAKGENSSIKLSGVTFLTVGDFGMFYNKHAPHYTAEGDKVWPEVQICFTDGCGILGLAFHDKDESITKVIIANLEAVAKKVGSKMVESMVM